MWLVCLTRSNQHVSLAPVRSRFSTAFFPPANRLTRDDGAAALLYERTSAILNRLHGEKLTACVGIPHRAVHGHDCPVSSEPAVVST